MTSEEAHHLLELTPPFTKSDLKKAYREAQMVWHPDRFQGNDELQAKAHKRAYLINEAFTLLARGLGDGQTSQKPPQPERADEPTKPHSQATPPQSQRKQANSSPPNPALEKKAAFIERFIKYWSTKDFDFVHDRQVPIIFDLLEYCDAVGKRVSWAAFRLIIDGDELDDSEIIGRISQVHRIVRKYYSSQADAKVLIVFSKHAHAEDFLTNSSRSCVHPEFWRKIYTRAWIGDIESEIIHNAQHPIGSIDIGGKVIIHQMNKVLFKNG